MDSPPEPPADDDPRPLRDSLASRARNPELIIDTIPALVWSARPDGSADFFNRLYLDFAGLSLEQASGVGWTAAVHPDDVAGLAETWQRILASEAPGEAEARLRRHDGEYRWFLMRANPLRDESGIIVKWYGVNVDVDDLKRAQERLRRSEAFLVEGQRLSTASIAHEINQPLSGIMTNAGTCLRMLDAVPPNIDGARETARRTIRDANRASDVVTRLRALFSKKAFTPEALDLSEATREVIALSSDDLQRNRIVLQVELADDLPSVTGDRIQIQQVIMNLLRNASDAMLDVHDRQRLLLIKTERGGGAREDAPREDGARDDRDRQLRHWVRLIVRDTGVGLPAQGHDSLFDVFYTTKSGGMGIGLFVCRSIIERHQGRLWAAPNDDAEGATFSFSLPSQVGSAAKAMAAANTKV